LHLETLEAVLMDALIGITMGLGIMLFSIGLFFLGLEVYRGAF
jgi:hypothetical protein